MARKAVFRVLRLLMLGLGAFSVCAGLYTVLSSTWMSPKLTALEGLQQGALSKSDSERCNNTCETGSEGLSSGDVEVATVPFINIQQENFNSASAFLEKDKDLEGKMRRKGKKSDEAESKGKTGSKVNIKKQRGYADFALEREGRTQSDFSKQTRSKGNGIAAQRTDSHIEIAEVPARDDASYQYPSRSPNTSVGIYQTLSRALQVDSSNNASEHFPQEAVPQDNSTNEGSAEVWEEWPKSNFSERANSLEPSLAGSIQPWNDIDISLPSFPSTHYFPLAADVDFLDKETLSCRPTVFGFSPWQATQTFVAQRPYLGCCVSPHSFLSLENNTVSLACTSHFSDIMVGKPRRDERLGDVYYSVDWTYGATSKQMGDSEYAFGRCDMWNKEAILQNKFNQTAATRARNSTEELRKSLGTEAKVRPLGVYLLVFDSVSRLHFYRNFPHSVAYVNSYLNSTTANYSFFDFQVNNAQGENTAPNMISMLYGLELEDIKEYLKGYKHTSREHEFKFIEGQKMAMWKEMERRGFVTLFGFDTVWDYLSYYTGRVIDTDHMISNFYHAARRIVNYDEFASAQHCIGCRNSHYYSLNYIAEFHRNYREYNRFGYIHISTGHEHTGTVIQTADDDLLHLLQRLFTETSPDEDIAVMIASDHGLHVGAWDRAYEGFIENQLPLHLLITNNALLERLGPNTEKILRHNTQRLVSRWDWHLTFQHLSTVPYGRLLPDSDLYETWKRKSETPHAVSLLLEEIPDSRICADVHIPLHYCSCLSFSEVLTSSLNSSLIVSLPINYINAHISSTHSEELCHSLSPNALLKAYEQVISPTTRHYKIRFSIKESPKAIFDAVLWVQFQHTTPPPSLINNHNHTYTQVVKAVQLQEVIRTDEYAGICEQLAKEFGVRASFCICQLPFPEVAFNSTTFTDKIDLILSHLSVFLPERGVNCVNACLSQSKVCAYWALPLLNDQRILQQAWRANSTIRVRFLGGGLEQTFGEVNVVEWRREGTGVRLFQTYSSVGTGWIVSQTPWTKELTCSDSDAISRQLCPCY